MLKGLQTTLRQIANPEYAKHYQKFFRTGKGEYGEGDIFLGIRNPDMRAICKKYSDLGFDELRILLSSALHEERFCALIILVEQFKKVKKIEKNAKRIRIKTHLSLLARRFLIFI